MTTTGRRLTPALAPWLVAVAGLLLAGAATAQDDFVERDLDVLRRPDGRLLQNVYWISLPLIPDVDDLANTTAPNSNKCAGEPGAAALPDGILNTDDLICAWWTARSSPNTAGFFAISVWDPSQCVPITRAATVSLGGIRFSGTPMPLQYDAGYQVMVGVPAGSPYSPRNRAILKGWHDPAWTGRPIVAAPTCPTGSPDCCASSAPRRDLVALPYASLLQTADEVLCGLANVDWIDADGDGLPDACWDDSDGDGERDPGEAATGVFDGRHGATVSTWINDVVTNGPLSRTVTFTLGSLRWSGPNFALGPSEAYLLQLSPLHEPTTWFPERP